MASAVPGRCCQQCLRVPEGADQKLMTCSRCKAARYCSVDCQKKHWSEHKKTCQSHKDAVAAMKATHGDDAAKAWRTWLSKDCRAGLTGLVHSLLGNRHSTHLVTVITDYHPGSTPAFKIIEYSVQSLNQLREVNDTMYRFVTDHMEQSRKQIRQQPGRKAVMGYALAFCRDLEDSGQVMPCGVEEVDGVPFEAVDPDRIVRFMNTGSFQ